MSENALVSVIIPAYNAEKYIQETLDSILNQSYKNIEIIVINDGSTDYTEGVLQKYSDSRIHYFSKKNEGVSIARNTGFEESKGEYIVFFDADDIMSVDFVEKRLEKLENNKELGFCCSNISFFPIKKEQKGACENISSEVLLYHSDTETCPSNYMFRRNVLEKVQFNPQLASSADRLFILEVGQIAKGKRIEGGNLLYRVRDDSMSGSLTPTLVADNTLFYTIVHQKGLIPKSIYRQVVLKEYYIVGAMHFKIKKFFVAFRYLILYFIARLSLFPSIKHS